jgi:hypothetical protein
MDDLNRKRILKIFEKLLVLQVNEMASVGGTLGYFKINLVQYKTRFKSNSRQKKNLNTVHVILA